MNNNKSINEYNFFELCGFDMSKEEKDAISGKVNELIWKEFLVNDLEKLIREEDIEVINKMAEEDKDIVSFIISKYPNIKDVLWRIAENTKKEIILNFFNSELNEIKNALKFGKNEDFKKALEEKNLLYSKAKEIAAGENWDELHDLFTSKNS